MIIDQTKIRQNFSQKLKLNIQKLPLVFYYFSSFFFLYKQPNLILETEKKNKLLATLVFTANLSESLIHANIGCMQFCYHIDAGPIKADHTLDAAALVQHFSALK